jgi:secretion/DNA translocation related TadE-like protein
MSGNASAPDRRRGDLGVATVWAVVLITVLSLVTFVAAGLTGVIAARHRAESAADLAALAGAVSARDGGDPCAAAAAMARSNDGELISCTADLQVVEVSVGVVTPVLWGTTWKQVGVARAGPAETAQSRGSDSK